MPSYLLVAFPGRRSFFQVHALQQGIFAIALTDFQDGLLSLSFSLELSLFLLFPLLLRSIIGEQIELSGLFVFAYLAFMQDMGCIIRINSTADATT